MTKQYILEVRKSGQPNIRCTAEHPCPEKWVKTASGKIRVYHPDAKVVEEDGSYGWDERYQCPHCQFTWWVECDG